MKKKCTLCKNKFTGRADKKFCSIACKNDYHVRLRRVTTLATKKIDNILHRNRSILLEILGKRATQKMTNRSLLDERKFNFNYLTGYYVNNKGKTNHYIYDFSYMVFSDDKIMIKRMKKH